MISSKTRKACKVCLLEFTPSKTSEYCSKKCSQRSYYLRNKERLDANIRKYYFKNHEREKKRERDRYKKLSTDKEWRKHNGEIQKKSYLKNRDKKLAREKRNWREKRLNLLNIIGQGVCKCKVCGFSDYRALQVDHINGGGNKEKKQKTRKEWLENMIGNPSLFQILCANCNWIKVSENNEYRKKS